MMSMDSIVAMLRNNFLQHRRDQPTLISVQRHISSEASNFYIVSIVSTTLVGYSVKHWINRQLMGKSMLA